MKKLTLLLAIVFVSATTFGQTKTDAKKDQTKQAVKTEQAKPAAKPAAKTEQAKPATAPAAAATAAPVKKDGTPDKRFKENKETPKPAGPVKKDGTPDMRYKSNKEAAPVKK